MDGRRERDARADRRARIGLRGSYAAYQWANPSAAGTLPLPSEPGTWGIGPEVRVAIPFDHQKRFALGLAANMMRYQTPYAEWTLTGPQSANGQTAPCVPSTTCVSGYSLFDERSESHLVYSFGLYPSIALGDEGEYGHVFAMFGGTNGFKNDGFANTPTNGSSIDVTGPVWMVGGGYGIDARRVRCLGDALPAVHRRQLARRLLGRLPADGRCER